MVLCNAFSGLSGSLQHGLDEAGITVCFTHSLRTYAGYVPKQISPLSVAEALIEGLQEWQVGQAAQRLAMYFGVPDSQHVKSSKT